MALGKWSSVICIVLVVDNFGRKKLEHKSNIGKKFRTLKNGVSYIYSYR